VTARPDRTAGRTTAPRPARGRNLRAAALALAAAAALAGCSATNTITTQTDDEVSDGVGVDLGPVRAGNVLVLTAAEGEEGTVVGYVANAGSGAVEVAIGAGTDATTVEVPAGGTALLGPEHEEVVVDPAGAPGSTMDLTFTVRGGRTATVPVPVLDGTLPEYAELLD
jgi:hypothetical protein